MLPGPKVSPEVDDQLIRSVFGHVGVPAAQSVLQDRGISYVAYNEEDNTVVIITGKSPRQKDKELFYNLGLAGIPISIVGGGVGHAGRKPVDPKYDPFIWRNDFYTCGSSVYLSTEKGAGTLGYLVQDADGILYGLSANHVTGGSNYAELTLPIFAPGQLDIAAGQPQPFVIGNHYSAMPFIDGLPNIVDVSKNLDAAMFKIASTDRVSSFQRNSFDTPSTSGGLRANMEVMKLGRTSGLTRGKVIGELPDEQPIIYEIDVIGGRKVVYFEHMFVIKGTGSPDNPFAQYGDSGSLIVTATRDEEKQSVGLVIGVGENDLTLALSLDRILEYFGVSIVSGHNI
jgi:hypothetical protein